jgi:ABC-type thiamin/hydroxymethylpyrimidine transport system permease subunit
VSSSNAHTRYHFSTRDLVMMAVLAALGGVTSTAVNALGDAVQAALGFAGTTQWAAGLHVVWLVLAVGLTGKGGAGTVTGLLKGGVELLSGNTHGVLVVLVDVIAGLLVDVGFWPFRNKDTVTAYGLAGGLAAASNVFVFQLFATTPEDVLLFVWGVAALAFVSGVVLAGVLGWSLMVALRRAGVVKDRPLVPMGRWAYPVFLAAVAVLAIGAFFYLKSSLQGPPAVQIDGAVAEPFAYSAPGSAFQIVEREIEWNGRPRRYVGVPLRDILSKAGLQVKEGAILVSASDGYSFFITLDEVENNPDLLLAHQEGAKGTRYEIAGARNSKALVRNVTEIRVVAQSLIEVRGAVEVPFPYNPDDWQMEMDNGYFDFGYGEAKYQGASLGAVIAKWEPATEATTVVLHTRDGGSRALPLDRVRAHDIRIWNVNTDRGILFAVAESGGETYAMDVIEIEVQ